MCAKPCWHEIRTSRDSEWRLGLYDDVGDLLDENTRSGAIDASCLFAQQMLPALAKAVKHPDMTEDLAEILSTPTVKLEYEIETGVNVC